MEGSYIRVASKYLLLKRIGGGSFGDIFQGIHINSQKEVAIKLESLSAAHPQVINEAKVINILKGKGIPRIYWSGTEGNFNLMVMQRLWCSLQDLQLTYRFSLKSICMIGDQMIERIEWVHSKNYIHRDIKPDNFMIGSGSRKNLIYLIDFGLAKRYRDPKTLQHMELREGRALTGTARYASINTHMGIEPSRRDDIESIFYVLVYLHKGILPWQGLGGTTKEDKYQKIMESKLYTPVETIMLGFPNEITQAFLYVKSLKFEQKPDYEYLRSALACLPFDGKFEWIQEENKRESKENVLSLNDTQSGRKKKVKEEEDRLSIAETVVDNTVPVFKDRKRIECALQYIVNDLC